MNLLETLYKCLSFLIVCQFFFDILRNIFEKLKTSNVFKQLEKIIYGYSFLHYIKIRKSFISNFVKI